ncbi:MAG TPA: leucyl aminopeptidase, partial [Spirochaetota bacterium]|nr:leucyl aminopeptidase [Spirochaetota bacterium]
MKINLSKNRTNAKSFYPYFDDSNSVSKEINERIIKDKDYFSKKYQIKKYFLDNGEITVIRLGKKSDFDLETSRRFGSIVINTAKKDYDENFDIILDSDFFDNNFSKEDSTYALLEGLYLTNYEYDIFKTKEGKKFEIKSINLTSDKEIDFEKIDNKAQNVRDAIFLTRDLVNAPANVVNIATLQKEAERIANENNLKLKVKDKNALLKEGFNLLYSVGKAGAEEPRLVEIEYKYDETSPNICLIGKGIVFDTGGLNLKPENFMADMKSDMAGAGSALSLIEYIAKSKMPINVTTIMPLAENAIDSNSYRPGDVILGYNKKSVEILNTDAEGRLILADALSYADTKDFDLVIDFATLTGAAVIALGTKIAASFFRNNSVKEKMFNSSKKCGEPIWELPLFEEYKENLKGDIADIANLGTPQRQAGSIMGALFLSEFIKNGNWIHFDIAGTSHLDKEWYYNPKGGTGFIMRTI